ncbi:MAG: hypothetical protein DHS20C15_08190 [Planctomycetota bacterium]|nr:MAG: hypothetical protein DHS20C15_08190 [Planctomycetota bacterium]
MTDPEHLQVAVGEALEFLGRAGKSDGAGTQLAERAVSRGDAKVRKQLADAVYDLARRCVQAHEKTGTALLFGMQEMQSAPKLTQAIGSLANRAAVADGDVTVIAPAVDSAEPLQQAIEVLERLEGRTDSWKALVAWEAMTRHDFETALRWSLELSKSAATEMARQGGVQSAAKALIDLHRLPEAEQLLKETAEAHGESDLLLFNLAFVHAAQGHLAEFERVASAFRDCPRQTASMETWSEAIEDQLEEFCRATNLSANDIRQLFGVEQPHGGAAP